MLISILAVVMGLAILTWSAGRFVESASITASYCAIPPLLIGIVVLGFGTSAPELTVSTLAALKGSPSIALGNAYGSNIANIALVLGVTAVLRPVAVKSDVLRKELPILTGATALAIWQLWDGELTRIDGIVLLVVFGGLFGWVLRQGLTSRNDSLTSEIEYELNNHQMPVRKAVMWLFLALLLLIVSSRLIVWGAVKLAISFGVSDYLIGLTIIAVGTSLPEMAASISAARKGEYGLALGNVLGSNLFNTLAVVGIAATLVPMSVDRETYMMDLGVMAILTLSLFIFGYGFKSQGRINRFEGVTLLIFYCGYMAYLVNRSYLH